MKITFSRHEEKFELDLGNVTRIIVEAGVLQAYRGDRVMATYNLSVFGYDDNLKALIELDDNE